MYDSIIEVLRVCHYSRRTEEAYVHWIRRYIEFHQRDLSDGYGRVELPHALARKYPNANRQWCWQFVFPQERRWRNRQTGAQGRHHMDESLVQKAVTA